MFSRYLSSALLATILIGCAGCRQPPERPTTPTPGSIAHGIRQSELQPGQPDAPPPPANPIKTDEATLARGKELYNNFNCSGCHAAGGGAIGPPLMDDEWIYGSAPRNVYATIVQGRPQGMPAFTGRINEQDLWKLVAYVRSLSGLHKNPEPAAESESQPEPTRTSSRGEEVFLNGPCAMCHSIRGTVARSRFGPDLTHVASRDMLASGTFPNRRGYLAGWILNPQNLKPGSKMPPTQLPGDDLNALLDYLESLR